MQTAGICQSGLQELFSSFTLTTGVCELRPVRQKWEMLDCILHHAAIGDGFVGSAQRMGEVKDGLCLDEK